MTALLKMQRRDNSGRDGMALLTHQLFLLLLNSVSEPHPTHDVIRAG